MSNIVSLRESHIGEPLRLGERLLRAGRVTQDQIQIALHEQRGSRKRLGEILVQLGFLNDRLLADTLADHTGLAFIDLKNIFIDPDAMNRVPPAVAQRCRAVPVSFDDTVLRLAVADPLDIGALDEIRRYFPHHIDILQGIASETDITETLETHSGSDSDFDTLLKELEGLSETTSQDVDTWQHPLVRIVNHMLTDAVRKGASDIHLEPENSFVRLRVRIDGVLRQTHAVHRSHWPQLSRRLKIMAGMDISDTRSMQDGSFHMCIGGADIDFRMAIMPTVRGENIVVRILDHRCALLPLEALGYDPYTLEQMRCLLERPEGIVLVTGPTGSGKTTTLYAMLKKLSSVDVNIMTLEEPVEYQFEMIRQTSIQEQKGFGFAEGVRGILRQAPDIIFIGEIRDDDTAKMALRAAMTGHRVFSTLHCNDTFGSLPRLNDLNLSSHMLSENIVGIVAKRLVRKLCPRCKRLRHTTREERNIFHIASVLPENERATGLFEAQASFESPLIIADAKGCQHCDQTGYKGRMAVVEILRISPKLDELIASGASRTALRAEAERDGFQPMAADGLAKVLRHETSLDELRRNVDLTRLC